MANDHPLKAYRRTQSPKLTQEQLAGLLGVNRTTVARWETGREIDEGLLPKIAKKTGIPADVLRPELKTRLAKLIAGAAA